MKVPESRPSIGTPRDETLPIDSQEPTLPMRPTTARPELDALLGKKRSAAIAAVAGAWREPEASQLERLRSEA